MAPDPLLRLLVPPASFRLQHGARPWLPTTPPRSVIEHPRYALSQPRVRRNTELPTTGYTTIEHGSGLVACVRFIESPDVNSKGNLRAEANLEACGPPVSP
jgi:hypothetical protein